MSVHYVIETGDGEKLHVTTFGNENISGNRCVIFVHGFKGFKDWGFGPFLGEYFASRGLFVITFNFSFNGIGDSPTEYTFPEKFAANTYSREISELSLIIDKYRNGYWGKVKDTSIGLLGHSRGGAISLLTAPEFPEIKGVVTWASVANLDRFSKRQKEEWRNKGYIDVLNSRTNQVMKINKTLLDDLENYGEGRLNLKKALSRLTAPLLIAQGDQDLVVKPGEAEKLHEWSINSNSRLLFIKGAGHTFGISHPFQESNDKFDFLLEQSNKFFNEVL